MLAFNTDIFSPRGNAAPRYEGRQEARFLQRGEHTRAEARTLFLQGAPWGEAGWGGEVCVCVCVWAAGDVVCTRTPVVGEMDSTLFCTHKAPRIDAFAWWVFGMRVSHTHT